MQVINAAYTLVRKPGSIVGLKSMSVFKETWAENVSALTEAVDAITSLDEFMAVTGKCINKLNSNSYLYNLNYNYFIDS